MRKHVQSEHYQSKSLNGFDKLLNFCLEAISINSVLALFKVESFYNVLYTLPLFVRRHRLLERAIHTFPCLFVSAGSEVYTLSLDGTGS